MGKRKFIEPEPQGDSEVDSEAFSDTGSYNGSSFEEEFSGESEIDERVGKNQIETERQVAEKRLKMAKEYLANLGHDELKGALPGAASDKEDTEGDVDAKALDEDLIASRLRKDALQAKGKHFESIADEVLASPEKWSVKAFRGHNQTPTCVAMTRDGAFAFTASKGGDIIKWDLLEAKKVHIFGASPRPKAGQKNGQKKRPGHSGQILCIAVSFDGKFVATGGVDKTIQIWDGLKHQHLASFTQHRGPVTSLSFQYGTYQLYSSSADRTVKIWALDQLVYIDTLFGHQDSIPAIDSLAFERCLTVGFRDRTVRLWKIPEESQLIYRLSEEAGGALECAKLIDEDHFVTGSDTGSLSVWSLGKKKPFKTHYSVHGSDVETPGAETKEVQHAITALATCPFTDLIASGSDTGKILLWKLAEDKKSLLSAGAVEMPGFINGLAFSENGRTLVAVIGRDQRLGRWVVDKTVQNRFVIIKF